MKQHYFEVQIMKSKLDKAKVRLSEVANEASKHSEFLKEHSKKVSKSTIKTISNLGINSSKTINTIGKGASVALKETGSMLTQAGDKASKVDMFSSKLRKQAIDDYNLTVSKYEEVALNLEKTTQDLYNKRLEAVELVKIIEDHINQLANTPKEFSVYLEKIALEIDNFQHKQSEIKKAEVEAKLAAGSSSAGASLSALGVAVATMGPTAAMGIATTFGVASTGTAISTLSGAAATNAALAWLGGGALAAGGGGMTAGNALLALAGPVGWTIAGIALTASVGTGLFASYKNKETAIKLISERENLELIVRKFNNLNADVEALIEVTDTQIEGVKRTNSLVIGADYNSFSKDEKMQAGLLVNSTLTLAQLVNKELKLND